MASVTIQVPSPRPQGPESLLMTLCAGLTPKRSPLSAGGKGTNGGAISNAHMSEVKVNNSRIQINNSINIVSLKEQRPPPSEGPGPQTN
ncbi:hypothetical protein L6164_022683 [Bauhinia variegata]|uniref:Uncharacterized protein n=1 Tax=Bauhinia variegata TaxID=167791 RepID=A0ACB9MGD5_BAUVA|nr:hypothetical protein L6164_022683 [Bauhinia variegata]